MGVGLTSVSITRFKELVAVLEDLEQQGVVITRVKAPDGDLVDEDGLTVALDVRIPVFRESPMANIQLASTDSTLDETGKLATTLDIQLNHDSDPEITPTSPSNPEATPEQPSADSGVSSGEATKDEPADSPGESQETDEHRSTDNTADGGTTTQESDEPKPYEDPDRLRAVYEEYDWFPQTTEALGADVTPRQSAAT